MLSVYDVFFGDDGQQTGGRFALRTDPQDAHMLNIDTGTLTELKGHHSIDFSRNKEPFEFCGAGALSVADYLSHRTKNASLSIDTKTLTFCVGQTEGAPWVEIPKTPIPCHPVSVNVSDIGTEKGAGTLYFPEQNTFLHRRPQRALRDFTDETIWRNRIQSEDASLILISIDSKRRKIDFRYFTSFQDKWEDAATGSIFRYLTATHLEMESSLTYEIRQWSASGASMWLKLSEERLRYGGNVRREG